MYMSKISRLRTCLLFAAVFLLSGCYDEQHFSLPGPYEDEDWSQDSMPFPFSAEKTDGIYLIKNGVADFNRVSTRGFTDFAPEISTEQYSWYHGLDRHGNAFFGSRQHKNYYQLDDADNFGGNKFSYECNDLYSRPFLEFGADKKWYVYAKMAIESLGHDTRCNFVYEGNSGWSKRGIAGFDKQHTKYSNVMAAPKFYFFRNEASGTISDDSYEPCYLFFEPGEPFEYELVCVNGFAYCRVNGTTIWVENLQPTDHSHPLMFRPWTNAVHFYDLYIEGDYEEVPVVAAQQESGYQNIQAPALTKHNDEILLFAEGRLENLRQEAVEGMVRSNATDIVLKRSTDGGDSWSELNRIVGGDGSVNMRPSVLTDNTGKIHLIYTVDRTGKAEGDYTIMYSYSEDGGNQWSAPREIACDMGDYIPSTNGGHGIQTSAGDLIFTVQGTNGRVGTLATVRSTDGGATWVQGNPLPGFRNRYANLIEDNGKLIMYIGHNGGGNSRKISISEDWGENWTEPVETNINTGNQGYISSGATVKTPDNRLVHFTSDGNVMGNNFALASTPGGFDADLKARKEMYIYRSPDFSSGMTVQISDNMGASWEAPRSLLQVQGYKDYKFLTGNMDAIVVDEHTVICVSEGGVSVPYEGLLSFKVTL